MADAGQRNRVRVVTLIDRLGAQGGAERLALEIACGLNPKQFQSTLCVSRWSTQTRDEGTAAALQQLQDRGVGFLGLSRELRVSLRAWQPLIRYLRRERIDILHAHKHGSNAWAPLLGHLGRVPVVLCHEHTWSFVGQPIRRFIDREIVAKRSDGFIAVSREDQRRMTSVEGIPPEQTIFVPNGIRAASPSGHDVRAELGLTPDDEVVTAVAFLRPEKALSVLVDAAARLREDHPKLRVLIVGEGEEEAALRDQIERRSLKRHVLLLGRRSDIPDVLAASDCGVLSSDAEGSPLSVMEFMAAGLPVVATSVGGIPDLIDDGVHGLLVPPRNPEALANALRRIFTDRHAAAEMGELARRRQAQEFDLQVTVDRLSELYMCKHRRATGSGLAA